jgi:uncharacterized protein
MFTLTSRRSGPWPPSSSRWAHNLCTARIIGSAWNGLAIAADSGADILIVRLFAVLHDSKRRNESHDPEHGARAAAWSSELRGRYFDLSDSRFKLLSKVCIYLDKGETSGNTTIGTCWDADRLARVGIRPHESYMSTAFGRSRVRT